MASSDDAFYAMARAKTFAEAWGSRLVIHERAGHINTDSGYGPWPEGRALLDELLRVTAA